MAYVGGRTELAPPKRGLWYAEPKLNGWRALIHTPTGTMWNRHGDLLTIAEFFRPALAALAKLADQRIVWADCEALERRHNLGRGTLVVLDFVPETVCTGASLSPSSASPIWKFPAGINDIPEGTTGFRPSWYS